MRRAFLKIMALLVGSAAAHAAPPADEVRAFHDLVAIGGAPAVIDALARDPSLATATGEFGFQAIHMLDYRDTAEVAAALIRAGADINAVNDMGHSILHMSIDPDVMAVAIAAGADVNLRAVDGRTPLQTMLAEPDSYDFIVTLLDAGADPNVRNEANQTALRYGAAIGAGAENMALIEAAGGSQ